MANRSLIYNGADADGRCEVRRSDMREHGNWLREGEAGCFDLVTGTPPYFPVTHVTSVASEDSAVDSAGGPAAADGEAAPQVAIGAIGALPTCRQSAPARYEFRGG